MPCYHPIQAWRSKERNPSGKFGLVFKIQDGQPNSEIKVPCGKCIGCRLEYSKMWALRGYHELQLHEFSCYLTLTYNEEHLPETGSLVVKDWQNFMKRYRKYIAPTKIRFMACGEYGDENFRPHYHAIIFGHDFPDKKFLKFNKQGDPLYTSATLNRIWGKGYVVIGGVTFDSIAYVARYITKKINGNLREKIQANGFKYYERVDPDTGEILEVLPEFFITSRRPGIAKDWFVKFKTDVYPKDYVTYNGIKMKAPKYYDQLMERENPVLMEVLKQDRQNRAKSNPDNTRERLRAREIVQKAAIKNLKKEI